MTDEHPHTAQIADATPDQRQAPRPVHEGVHELRPRTGSSCPSVADAGHADTPGESTPTSLLTERAAERLRGEIPVLQEVLAAAADGEVVSSRLAGVVARLERLAVDLTR